MATMDHINVVRLYSVCMGKQMMLVSQFVRLGSLLSYLKKYQSTLDAYSMLNFSKQISDVSMPACLIPYWGGVLLHLCHNCTYQHLFGLCLAKVDTHTRIHLLTHACMHSHHPPFPHGPGDGIFGGEEDGPQRPGCQECAGPHTSAGEDHWLWPHQDHRCGRVSLQSHWRNGKEKI